MTGGRITRGGKLAFWSEERIARLAVVAVLVGVAAYSYLSQASQTTILHRVDLLELMLNTPVPYVAPLLIAVVASLGLSSRLSTHFVVYTRNRVSLSAYLLRGTARAAAVAGAVFAGYTLLAFLVAFFLLPGLGLVRFGSPGVLNGFTSVELEHFMQQRFSFGQLLAYGDLTFGLGLALWVGIAAAVYAVLAQALVIVVRNRVLGLLMPFAIATVETVVVALLDVPQFGLWYVMFPFGLTQQPIPVTMAPIGGLLVLAASLWAWILRHPDRFETLG